jgi:hypothetical protein
VPRVLRLALTALMVTVLASACATTIRDVRSDPTKYRGRDVTVSGVVSESLSLLGRGAYRVTDKTGDIWVVSQVGVPRKGAKVKVSGTTRSGFDLGSFGERVRLPAELTNGVVLMESSHSVR